MAEGRDQPVHDKLDDTGGGTSSHKIRLTRRAFVGLSTILPATPVIEAFAADLQIGIRRTTEADFSVIYGGKEWPCHMAAFGPGASHKLAADVSVRPGDELDVVIEGIRFPGTDLTFTLTLTFHFIDEKPAIRIVLPAYRLDQTISLVDWMDGTAPFTGVLSAAQAAALAKALDHRSISSDGRLLLAMLADGTFVFEPLDGPLTVSVNKVALPLQRVHLAALRSLAPDDFPALTLLEEKGVAGLDETYEPAQDRSFLWAFELADEAGGAFGHTRNVNLKIGKLRLGESGERPPVSIVFSDLSASSKTCVLAKAVEFDAGAKFEADDDTWREHVANWPHFALLGAMLRQIVVGRRSRTYLTAAFRRSATYSPAGHVPLTITGSGDVDFIAEAGDDAELTSFRATAGLNHAFVAMLDADYSRIDFERTEIRYGLVELEPDPQASAVAAGYWLACPPVFSVVMNERAMVRVMRSADLLSLGYSFRDIYLVSRPGHTVLDSCENCLPGFKLQPGRAPLMIVRFPAQHIAEKAYLEVRLAPGEEGVKPVAETVDGSVRHLLARGRLYDTAGGSRNASLIDAGKSLRAPATAAVPPDDDARRKRRMALAKVMADNQQAAIVDRDKDVQAIQQQLGKTQWYFRGGPKDILEVLDHVVEARTAGPTRLVFEFDQKSFDADPATRGTPMLPRPYSVDALTQWQGLKAKVAARALRRDAIIADQMRLAGLGENDWAVDKAYRINLGLHPPGPEETAIEFPYRLQLSPADDARWNTPLPLTPERIATGVPLWSARLDLERGGRSVRALWSPDFEAGRRGFFLDGKLLPHNNDAPWADPAQQQYRMSLDARDRQELVTLTSVYGLPALLPVPDPNVVKGSPDENTRATSTVLPIPKPFRAEKGLLGEQGVFVPQPLASARMALTSLGATMDLQGQWEPPSAFTLEDATQPLWPALTVERWHHQAFLGRDTFVEIVYKGFLFPLGHRCAVIKATERKFRADPNVISGKAPVAYLIQRYFIVVGEPNKHFPAVGQRFDGRALFATSVGMLTTTTPDILDPFENKLNKADGTALTFGEAGGSAFFPKTQKGDGVTGAVEFEYEVEYADGEKRKLNSPLLVVDNTLAHDPGGIAELVDYYNGPDIESAARKAGAGGQRFRYAEDKTSGSTEFVTDHWELGSHGRKVDHPDPNFQFTMDAVMEGADQPPFYPVCFNAAIEVQSLNYMNGTSQGFTQAAYDLNYLDNGFSPANNPSGIFLSLPGDRTDLTLDSNTKASGGLATPNMRAVALSREKGPVGGTRPTSNLGSALGNGAQVRSSGFDLELSQAQSGQFDPMEALASALKLPKLFGIIPLQKLIPLLGFIDGAPEAIESTAYQISEKADQFVATAQGIAASVDAVLLDARAQLNDSLAAYSTSLGLTTPIDLADLYPGLASALNGLHASLQRLVAVGPAVAGGNLSAGTNAVGDTAAAIQSTLREVKSIARHPTPALLDDLVKRLTEAFKGLGGVIRQIVRDQLKLLLDEIAAELTLSVVFEYQVQGPEKQRLRLYVNGEDKSDEIDTSAIEAELRAELHPLYQIMTAALTGRPDSWVEVARVEQGVTRTYKRLELTFNPQNLPRLHAEAATEEAKKAAAAAAAQAVTEVLLYDDVVKPLLEGYALVSQLVAAVEQGTDDIEKQIRALPRQLVHALESWLTGLVDLQRLFAIGNSLKAEAETLAKQAFDDFVAPLLKLPLKMADSAAEIDGHLVKALDTIDRPGFPPPIRAVLDEERVKLTKLRLQLRTALADYEELRSVLGGLTGADLVANFERNRVVVSQSLGKLFAAQSDVLLATRDVIAVANDAMRRGRSLIIEAADQEFLFAVAAAQQVAFAIVDGVISGTPISSSPAANAIIARVDAIDPGTAAKLGDRLKQHNATVDEIHKGVTAAKATALIATNAAVDDAIAKAETFLAKEIEPAAASIVQIAHKSIGGLLAEVARLEQAVSGLAMRGLLIGEEALQVLDARLFPPVQKAVARAFNLLTSEASPLGLYAAAEKIRERLDPAEWLEPHQDIVDIVKLFLNPKIIDAFDTLKASTGGQNLADERDIIQAVQDNFAAAASFGDLDQAKVGKLVARFNRWRAGDGPEPAKILEPLQLAADLLLSSKLSDLIDLGALERELAKQLLAFLPLQATFDYDWGVPLKPFPGGPSRMFWIDETRKGIKFADPLPPFGPFKDKVRLPAHDLAIYVRAGVDLRTPSEPKPIFITQAEIQYANIHLFGPSLDVVIVKFDQIRFTVDDTGSDFSVKLAPNPVQFGPVVGYIEELAKLFGGGNGIYLLPTFSPMGIVIGYRYAQDEMFLGTLSLLNFAIDISVRLSFDNTPVAFRFALAERDKPLTIICTPYGGAGYLALRTVATEIVSFEMQLEFGGAVAISFPPLSAYGFVSAGIYIEKSEGKALILEGFVRAIGEGSIFCFTISVFFEVRVRQEGSNVSGQLTVSVSFKVGFVKLTYSYTAAYQFSGKQGGNSKIEQAGPRLNVRVADRVRNWRRYRAYFAEGANG